MSHIFSPVGQRGTVWRSTGWSPNRTEQLLYKVFWHLWDGAIKWDVTGSLVLPSSETETLMLTEPKPVSQISTPPPVLVILSVQCVEEQTVYDLSLLIGWRHL